LKRKKDAGPDLGGSRHTFLLDSEVSITHRDIVVRGIDCCSSGNISR
jgi:hypothetical protein